MTMTLRTRERRAVWLPPFMLLFAFALPSTLGAQQGTDAHWFPWLGCWESETASGMLCVLPLTGDVGVEMVSVDEGRVVSRETVRADGASLTSDREGCSGSESARFSDDGQRIYMQGQHLCGGLVQQTTRGLWALLSSTEWVDVRAMSVGGETMTAISRYRLAPIDVAAAAGFGDVAADRAMAVRASRVAAAGALTVDAVIDAHAAVGPSTTAVWVAARGQPLRLDAERLIRMGDAGVAGELIDVVVAVSHPASFSMGDGTLITEVAVEPVGTERPAYREPRGYLPGRGGFFDPFYGYYDPFGYGYGYGSGYRYDQYGYGYGSGYYPGVFRPVVVVVEPSSQTTGGRVVKGRGYSQSPAPRTQSSGSSGSSSPAPAPSSSGGTAAPAPAPAPRTAQPRDPPPGG